MAQTNITRASIINNLLKHGDGKNSVTEQALWDSFCSQSDRGPNTVKALKPLLNLKKQILRKWRKSGSFKRFEVDNRHWLQDTFKDSELPFGVPECTEINQIGEDNNVDPFHIENQNKENIAANRKRKSYKSYEECTPKHKKRRNTSTFDDVTDLEILDELKKRIKNEKFKEVLDKIYLNPIICTEILEDINRPKPQKLSSTEGLAMLTELNLTNNAYSKLKKTLDNKNVSILPTLHDIIAEKKQCYPPNIKCSSKQFEIQLQDILIIN